MSIDINTEYKYNDVNIDESVYNMSIGDFCIYLNSIFWADLYNDDIDEMVGDILCEYNLYNGYRLDFIISYNKNVDVIILTNIPTQQDIRAIKLLKINKKINEN